MKKSIITATAAAFVVGMAILPSVYAADLDEKCNNVTEFSVLAECIDSAEENGGTITLGSDIILNSYQEIDAAGKEIIIDLGKYTITRKTGSTFSLENGDLTIKGNGGKIISENGLGNGSFYVFGSGNTHLTIEKGVTLSGDSPLVISNNGVNTGIVVDIYGDIINDIKPEVSSVDTSAIAVHGLVKTGNPKINIYGNVKSNFDAGIYQAGDSTINLMPGSSVSGASGIVIKSGDLNINGATVTATGKSSDGVSSGSGFTSTGAAIQIDSNSVYAGDINISIEDSSIASENGNSIQAYGDNTTESLKSIKLEGDVILTAGEDKNVLDVADTIKTFEGVKDSENQVINLNNVSSYETPGDKTELNAAIKEAKSKLENESKYSNDTVEALKKAIASAEEIVNDETAGQSKIDASLKELKDAVAALKEEVSNPNTVDNIFTYIILGIIGILGLGLTTKKLFLNNKC